MRKLSCTIVALAALALLQSAHAQQCRDGVDNDADGKIDGLFELSPTNGEVFSVGAGDPEAVKAAVANAITSKRLALTPPTSPLVRADGGWEDNVGLSFTNLNKVCGVLGYATYVGSDCHEATKTAQYPTGRCNYHSPENNQLWRFNGVNFVAETAMPKYGKTWLSTITCKDRLAQCKDGADNDGDGKTDFPADDGCNSANDDRETPHDLGCTDGNDNTELEACRDGLDNDRDGLTDLADPGCSSAQDDNEGDGTSQCQDGLDNDRDGVLDAADPGCWTDKTNPATFDRTRNNEGAATTGCQDTIDNDNDGVIDAADPGCWTDKTNPATFDKTRNNEGAATTGCQDTIDNDNDGVIDAADPGCWTDKSNPATFDKTRNNEGAATTGCQDKVDNDNDGVIDAADPGCWTDKTNPATFDKTRNNEGAATTACQDLVDNDSDSLTDASDPGCWSDSSNPATFDKTRNNEGAATTACQDKVDNDGDGLIDLADPGCSNAVDTNEVDEVSKLQVSVDCVYDNGAGAYTAYFGYENLTGAETVVTADATKKTDNSFSPAPAVREQVTTFKVGRQKGAFGVSFNGDALTWTVQLASGEKSSATASRSSPACKVVEPVAECIDSAATGLKGTFGYVNGNEFEIKLGFGARNKFDPAPEDRGQPASFFPGTNKAAFSALFKDQLTWTLGTKTAVANSSLTVCPGGCLGTSTTEIKGSLDAVALKLADLTTQAADYLAKQAKAKLTGSASTKVSQDAARAKKKAVQFVERTNSLTIQFPAVVKSCPNSSAACATVDRGQVIKDLEKLYAQQRNAVKRIIARASFSLTGKTSRMNALVEEAKATEAVGKAGLIDLPRFSTECK